MACRRPDRVRAATRKNGTWAPSLNFRRMRLRGGWAQAWMALHAVAWEPYRSFPLSALSAKPLKPATGADRKRGQRPVAVAVGDPERRTFEMAEVCLPIRSTGLRS